jgi:RNA 2',3'-cyclic 3'-phosphodiesterase
MSAIRTFIALPASTEIQQLMSDVQSRLKATQADVKWELKDKFHITLKFLGDTEQSHIELLSAVLSKITKQFPAFEITYDSLGVFPNLHNPRVVWIGTKSNQAVLDLQSKIEETCLDFGFQKEERAFSPHITVGRVKGTRNLARLTEAIKTITFETMQSRCSEVLLMKSDLRPSGSIYTILQSIPLQPKGREIHV